MCKDGPLQEGAIPPAFFGWPRMAADSGAPTLFPTYSRGRIFSKTVDGTSVGRAGCLRSRGVVLSPRSEMLKSPLLGICVAVEALLSTGAQPAVARDGPGSDFSPITEWKNQIGSDLEHNKRYLPDSRTRGKIGTVRFELTMNRGGWVLPGTRIITVDPELGRVALLLPQQSQPLPAPTT